MKKIYLSLLGVGIFALTATAQNGQNVNYVMPQVHTGEITHPEPPRVESNSSAHRDAGDTIWIDGFEEPSNWEFISPTTGLDPNVNGWSIGNTNNSWRGDLQTMNTEGDYARFVNGDPTADPSTVVQEDPFIFLYTGTIPDLSDVPAPQLRFEHYGGRFWTHQAVQISINGGTDWITVASNDDIEVLSQAGGSFYGNADTRSFNISEFIPDEPTDIMLRLLWEGLPLPGSGDPNFIEYAWFVDNIRIQEGAPDDVVLSDIQYGKYDLDSEDPEDLLWDDLEYGIYDLSQVRPLILSANIFNNGANTQSNVQLVVTVSDANGVIETVSSDPATIAPLEEVSFELEYTPPAEVGEYTLLYSAIIEGDDAEPENNIGEVTFRIADGEFARDNGDITNLASIILEDGAQAGAGVGYYFTQAGEVHCIGAAIGEGSYSEIEYSGFIHEVATGFPSIANTHSRLVEFSALNGEGDDPVLTWMYTVEFDPFSGEETIAPHSVAQDDEWVFSIQWTPEAIDGDPEDIGGLFIGEASNTALSDGASFVWGPATTTGTVCAPCGGNVFNSYMIRLGMSEEFCESVFTTVSVDEIENVAVEELFPNPTEGPTTLSYSLLESSEVQIFLFDNNGRIIMNEDLGTQSVGEYRFDYDWSDQAAGMYTLSIHVNDKAVNKKLVIK